MVQTGVIAAVAIAFAKFSGVLFPWISPDRVLINLGFIKINSQQIVGVALIWLLSGNNLLGVKNAKIVQGILQLQK